MNKQRKRHDGIVKDPKSGVWRYYFMYKGRRYFKADPAWKTKSEAKAARDRRRIAVRDGRESVAEAETNFKTFVNNTFLPWAETNLAEGTYRSYRWRCDVLIESFGPLDLKEISQIGIERFKRWQLQKDTVRGNKSSPANVNRYLQVLASIFSRAGELGLIEKRPKIETLKEDNQRLRYLSTDEEGRLLAAAGAYPHLQDILVVGLATGLRRDELFSLQKEDIDLVLNIITVTDGKGGKLRTVPLDPDGLAARVLGRLKRESRSEWIFTSPHSGGKLTRVDRSLASACKSAGVQPITLHALRHTFCTRLAASGVDIRTIKELAGHADIQTTMRYLHLVESNKHQAIRLLRNYHEITTAEVIPLKSKTG